MIIQRNEIPKKYLESSESSQFLTQWSIFAKCAKLLGYDISDYMSIYHNFRTELEGIELEAENENNVDFGNESSEEGEDISMECDD